MSGNSKFFCNNCNTRTNHSIICEHKVFDVEEYETDGIKQSQHLGTTCFQILECKGCEDISFRKYDVLKNVFKANENHDFILAEEKFEVFYPERIQNFLSEKSIVGLPPSLRRAYREVIDSFNYDLRILCAAGLRALVEGICLHFGIKTKTLKSKIEGLSSRGLISKELSDSLNVHKFLGNYALHRLEIPESHELKMAIGLIEFCLETLFIVPHSHRTLKESLTKRMSST